MYSDLQTAKTQTMKLALSLSLLLVFLFVLGRVTSAWAQSKELNPKTPLTLKTPCAAETQRVEIALHRGPRAKTVRAPRGSSKRDAPLLDRDASWLRAQLSEANRLFAQIGVCFWMRDDAPISLAESAPKTRAQRTRLGRVKGRTARGRVDLFIVNRLGDIDRVGEEIRGVHWRDPRDRKRLRWILLSRIARPLVLAHELGHYFGLPHSAYPESIMNKRSRRHPPREARGFVKRELKIMRRRWRAMLKSGQLKSGQLKESISKPPR